MLLLLAAAAQARGSGITNASDDLRTGWYPGASTLTPQLVSGGSFGQLWSTTVKGQVYAQPLLSNGTLLVATEENNVYGLDPATGNLRWEKPLHLGQPWNPADIGCGDLKPWIGVTSTPVIDTATNVAYMTHKTYASGEKGEASWYMDAVNVATGVEQPGFPVKLSGAAQNAPSRKFSPTTQLQRPGLLLMDGVIYAAFGSHCDKTPWQGWIFGVSTAGKVTARYVDNTTEEGGGIWQSGAGLTSDGPGTILFSTGNGGAPSTPAAGNNPPANIGESVVRVRVQSDGSLKPVDFFAPFDAPSLDEYDSDFASGGVTGLPEEYFGTPAIPHLAVAVGKQGNVYLLNRDSLGGIGQGPEGSDNVVQRIGPRGGVWSRPGVWPGDGGWVYIPTSSGASAGGTLDLYKYELSGAGLPSLKFEGSSEDSFGWGSGAPVITSNGTASGSALVWIIWSTNRTGSGGQLRAYDPLPVNGRPVLRFKASIGTASNYSTPGVGDGRVYVGTREGKVLAFGSPVAAPLTGSEVVFPATTLGSTSQKTLTLTATEALTLSTLASNSSQFTLGIPSPELPATLGAGQKISIPVTFAPTQTGLVGAAVTATTSTGNATQFALSGTGRTAGAKLAVSPPLVSFGGAAVGAKVNATATFSNVGGQPLTINKVNLPGAPFSAEGVPTEGQTIAPGSSITVGVVFAPTQAGTFKDNIGLETTGGNGKVGLSGTAGAPGRLTITSEVNEYGSEVVGGTLTKSFTITNTGGTAVKIEKSKPPALRNGFEATTSLPEGSTIKVGESVTETVKFAPIQPGSASDGWEITGNDTSGHHDVLFHGTGIAPAKLAVSPSLLPLGTVATGGHLTASATFSNVGGQPLTINKINLPGAPFGIEGVPAVGQTIAAGGSIVVTVAFDPKQVGTFKENMGLETTGGNDQVELSGTATSAGAVKVIPEVNKELGVFGPLPPEQGVLAYKGHEAPPVPDAELVSAILAEAGGGTISVRVSCPARESRCAGTIALRFLAGHRHGTRKPATLTLATGSFTLAGGRVSTVKLHLSAKARKLLASRRVIRAHVTIAAYDPSGVKHTAHTTVTIHASPVKHGKVG